MTSDLENCVLLPTARSESASVSTPDHKPFEQAAQSCHRDIYRDLPHLTLLSLLQVRHPDAFAR